MNKKLLFVVIVFGVCTALFYYLINHKTFIKEPDTTPTSNTQEKNTIGNINNVSLYNTNYVYNNEIKGYIYQPVELTSEQVNNIKSFLSNIDLKNNINGEVYGQYKLVIDDKTIFFDINTDSALYLEKNIIFKLPNDIKKTFVQTNNMCSCCTTSNCNINLCECNNVSS